MQKGAHKDEVHRARDSRNSVLGTVYTFRFKKRNGYPDICMRPLDFTY